MHIFFDIDGTLIRYTKRMYDLYATYAHTHGYSALDKPVYLQKKREGVSERSIALETFPPGSFEEYISWKRSLIETPNMLATDKLVPGITPVLTMLARHHALIALSARQSKKRLVDQLKRLNILNNFSHVICVSDIANQVEGKTEGIRNYLITHHVTASQAVVVGDAEVDVMAAAQSSIAAIAVSWGTRSASFLARHGAHTVITTPDQLLRYLMTSV